MANDIDKNKVDRARYFACFAMLVLELNELVELPMCGADLKAVLDKYKVGLWADKKRCRVNLEIPKELNKKETISGLHKSLLTGYKNYPRRLQHFASIIKTLEKNRGKENG